MWKPLQRLEDSPTLSPLPHQALLCESGPAGAGVTASRKGSPHRAASRDWALRPAAIEETRRQACVAQREVLMGKAGKKLPTAMETSRKTVSLLGSKVDDAQLPRSQGGLPELAQRTTTSTPRGAPRPATLTGTRPP